MMVSSCWCFTFLLLLVAWNSRKRTTAHGFISTKTPLVVSKGSKTRPPPLLFNSYDDWRSDAVVLTLPLCNANVQTCLDTFLNSDYGTRMFGVHDLPARHGITGQLEFVELDGPQVILELSGKFWHRRETVLGRAAMWLHACMPEITNVRVQDKEELEDFEDIVDEWTGELLGRLDKRAPDFNGDRATMEYQGIDPDVRGPFPPGVGGGGSMINPI